MGSKAIITAFGTLAVNIGCTSSPAPTSNAESSGEPVVLTTSPTKAWTIGIDNDNVYWAIPGASGGLYSMSKSGGAVAALYEGPMSAVESLGIDATAVYFPSIANITSVPRTGGPPRNLATTLSPTVQGVAVVNDQVYWIDRDANTGPAPAIARSVSIGGGEPTSTELPKDIDTSGGAYFTIGSRDGVYASLVPGGGIMRVPLDVGAPTLLAVPEARGLASDSENLYFGAKGSLDAIPKAGGAIRNLAPAKAPFAVAIDDVFVYFTDAVPDGRVLKVAKAGGPVTVLADHQATPHAIAVDTTHVYWNCMDDRTIKRIAK